MSLNPKLASLAVLALVSSSLAKPFAGSWSATDTCTYCAPSSAAPTMSYVTLTSSAPVQTLTITETVTQSSPNTIYASETVTITETHTEVDLYTTTIGGSGDVTTLSTLDTPVTVPASTVAETVPAIFVPAFLTSLSKSAAIEMTTSCETQTVPESIVTITQPQSYATVTIPGSAHVITSTIQPTETCSTIPGSTVTKTVPATTITTTFTQPGRVSTEVSTSIGCPCSTHTILESGSTSFVTSSTTQLITKTVTLSASHYTSVVTQDETCMTYTLPATTITETVPASTITATISGELSVSALPCETTLSTMPASIITITHTIPVQSPSIPALSAPYPTSALNATVPWSPAGILPSGSICPVPSIVYSTVVLTQTFTVTSSTVAYPSASGAVVNGTAATQAAHTITVTSGTPSVSLVASSEPCTESDMTMSMSLI